MDPRSPSFEANLLYKTAPRFNINSVVEDFRCAIKDQGQTLHHVEQIDSVFTHLTCDNVDILIAYCAAPLPVEHFLGAERPSTTGYSEAEILGRLTLNQASITILVTDRDLDDMHFGAAHEEVKRNLCWDLTDCVQSNLAASLVFWSDTDTLYAAEEFERVCSYADIQSSAAFSDLDNAELWPNLPSVPAEFNREPIVNGAALAWLSGEVEESRDEFETLDEPEEDYATLDTLMTLAVPSRLTWVIDHAQKHLTPHRAINGVAMFCASATIGLSGIPELASLLG